MKNYIFSIDEVIFIQSISPPIAYDEVQHKIISEKIKGVSIKVSANDLKVAEGKMASILDEIILCNFGDTEDINNYKFIPSLIKVEEILED